MAIPLLIILKIKLNFFMLSIINSGIALVSISLFYIIVSANIIVSNNRALLAFFFILICAWLPYLIEIIFKLKITKLSLIFYHVFLVLSLILGSMWDFYTLIPYYDSALHTLSGVLIAFIVYTLFKNTKNNNNLGLVWLFVLIFSTCLAGGALWEIFEFVSDLITNGNMQKCLNLVGRDAIKNTMIDLICDTLGALIATIVIVFTEHKTRKNNNL